jgi:transcriptional regulator with PAS, ATPase and Fis domain
VGGTEKISIDIRVIAASNVSLAKLMAENRFRSDLFYRLNQHYIPLPPLRDRVEDIPPLSESFIREANGLYQRQVRGLSAKAFIKLSEYGWPGNVRELRNVILHASLFCQGDVIETEDIVFHGPVPAPVSRSPAGHLRKKVRRKSHFKAEQIEAALIAENGVVAEAARRLGIRRQMFYDLVRMYGIDLAKHR